MVDSNDVYENLIIASPQEGFPNGWKSVDIKHLFEVFNGSTPKSTEDSYWGGDIAWITPADMTEAKYIESSSRTITKDGFDSSNLTMANPGDIILSCRAPIGSVNIAAIPLCTNQGCKTLKPKGKIDTSFYYYYLSSHGDVLNSLGRGTTFMELSTSDLSNLTVPFPPLEIQKEISNHLDVICSKTDSIICNRKYLIDKLLCLKQSIISEIVTKGLDPDVPMKYSGIPWIGTVPADWNMRRMKNTCSLRGRIGWQGLKSSEFTDEGPYVITGTDFDNGMINWDTCNHFSDMRFDEDPSIHVEEGDLLITKDGTVGKVAVAINTPDKVSLNSGVLLIRPFIEFDCNYLRYVLQSNQFWDWYYASQRGNSTIKHLYQEQFYEFKFTEPPIDEQKHIASYLDCKCKVIDSLIKNEMNIISKIKEYRNSMIYEHVTGMTTISRGWSNVY